jgi:hypothetical protein
MVDGVAAAKTLLSFKTCDPGFCLFYVWKAYKANGAHGTFEATTAFKGWQGSQGRHEGNRHPPPGVPVFWGAKLDGSNSLGDVVISTGDGKIVATDFPSNGTISETTIDKRQQQIAREYLGWADNIMGAKIGLAVPAIAGFALAKRRSKMTYAIVKVHGSAEIDVVSLITGIRVRVGSPLHVNLLKALQDGSDDVMKKNELVVVRGYLTAINPPPEVVIDAQAVADALSSISQDVDPDLVPVLVNDAITSNSTLLATPEGSLGNRL